MEVNSKSIAAHTCFTIAETCQVLAHMASKKSEIEHHCTTGIIFVAFSIEAMINHFGKIMFNDEWESKKQPRKKQHRMLFDAVNLPNYLGSKTYQDADKCFKIRDLFAHGKTNDETLKLTVSPNTSFEDLLYKISDEPTSMERIATIENLDKYIEIALKIQEEIEEHGYYPDQDHIPQEERDKLCEGPLTVQGSRGFCY